MIPGYHKSICFVSPFAYPLLTGGRKGPGGAERQFFLFGRALAEIGWRVSFITDRQHGSETKGKTEFPLFTADFSYLGGSNLRLPGCWLSFLRALRKSDSYYYVVKTPSHLLMPMALFTLGKSRCLVFWAQTTFNNFALNNKRGMSGFMENWGLRRSDIVIAQIEEQSQGFKENYEINAQVVPSICDNLYSLDVTEVDSHINEKEADILWAGNSNPQKRQEVFFELAKLLPGRKFAIGMNNSDPIRFEQAEEASKKLSNVYFLGSVPPFEMETWFQKAKVFINTSIREGFPNTFLQAWMNGIPVVSLGIDPDHIIEKYGLGIVVALDKIIQCNDDPKALAQLMVSIVRKLLSNDSYRNQMGKAGREYVVKYHSPEVVVPKLISVLEEKDGVSSNYFLNA